MSAFDEDVETELTDWAEYGYADSRDMPDEEEETTCTHDIDWYWEVKDARMG